MDRSKRIGLVGNGWVLAGAVIYLLEFVAIIWAGVAGVDTHVAGDASEAMATYAGNEDVVFGLAGWYAIVLLGRILLFIGLRRALVDSGHARPLLDLAVVASAVSVTLEIAAYGLAAAATAPANAGDETLALLMDQAGTGIGSLVTGGLGVAIVSATYVMWRSRLFSLPLVLLGAVSGFAISGGQLAIAPSLQPLLDILSFFPFVFWVWMLWAGVVCFRARPARMVAPLTEPERDSVA